MTIRTSAQVWHLQVLVHKVLLVSGDRADGVLLPVAAYGLRAVGVLPATAITETLHHGVDLGLENLGELKKYENM
jgi:hypothetical protein